METFVTSEQNANSGARLLVEPQPAMPVSFEQIVERSRKLTDGTYTVESAATGTTYRDLAGRVRIESESRDGSGHILSLSVTLMDPTNGSHVVLMTDQKVALHIPFPVSSEGKMFFADAVDVDEPSHKWKVTSENAGQREIEGVEFDGTRIIQTAEDDPRLVKTFEYWSSDELKLTGAITISGLTEAYTVRIQNLRREDPDSKLFAIPSDYQTVNVQWPTQ